MSVDEPWSVRRHLDAQVDWETETGDAEDYIAFFEALDESKNFEAQYPASPTMDKERLTEPQVRARQVSRGIKGHRYDLERVSGVEGQLEVGNPAINTYKNYIDEEAPILGGRLHISEIEGPDGEMRDFDEAGDVLNWVASQKAMDKIMEDRDGASYVRFIPGSSKPVEFQVPPEGIKEEGNYGVAKDAVRIMGGYAELHREALTQLEEQLLSDSQVLEYNLEEESFELQELENFI